MSLARALTKRYRAQEPAIPSSPGRSNTVRKYDRPIDRSQISLPIELISTTNVLAYNAPDIYEHHGSPASSASSTKSYEASETSRAASSSSSISSPEISRESSPVSAEPNHLSTFFQPPNCGRASLDSQRPSNDSDVPAIPTRALSHTKKSHQAIAIKRSESQVRSLATSMTQMHSHARTSLDMFSGKPEANHPFGAELAQVNELAEEFAVKDAPEWDEEERFLVENGLQKFSAVDYALEIEGLFGGVFDDKPFPMGSDWI